MTIIFICDYFIYVLFDFILQYFHHTLLIDSSVLGVPETTQHFKAKLEKQKSALIRVQVHPGVSGMTG